MVALKLPHEEYQTGLPDSTRRYQTGLPRWLGPYDGIRHDQNETSCVLVFLPPWENNLAMNAGDLLMVHCWCGFIRYAHYGIDMGDAR